MADAAGRTYAALSVPTQMAECLMGWANLNLLSPFANCLLPPIPVAWPATVIPSELTELRNSERLSSLT